MDQEIQAIFENGAFRPVDPSVSPQPGDSFVVVRKPAAALTANNIDDASDLREQREALKLMFEQAESLPLEVAGDGFSGADHDSVLYGDQQ